LRKPIGYAAIGALVILAVLAFWLFRPVATNGASEPVSSAQIHKSDEPGQGDAALSSAEEREKVGENAASTATADAGDEGARLHGRVVLAESGDPAAGATVLLEDRRTVAGADGEFAFQGLSARTYRLTAERDGLLSFSGQNDMKIIEVTEDDRLLGPVELRLSPGAGLRVRVLAAADDRPVPGATVEPAFAPQLGRQTDERGMAYLTLPPQRWDMTIKAPLYRATGRSISLSAERETRETVRLEPGGSVSGLVTDQSGAPLPETTVFTGSDQGFDHAKTDEDGRYQLDSAPLGEEVQVFFSKPDFRREMASVSLTAEQRKATLNMTLIADSVDVQGLRVSGVVRDELGQPIAEARISAGQFLQRASAATDREGRFELVVPEEGFQDPKLLAEATGYAPKSISVVGDIAAEPLEIALAPGHRLSGRVVDETGAPVAGAEIRVIDSSSFLRLFGGDAAAETGPDGRFALDSLPPAPLLTVGAEGFSFLMHQPEVERDDVEFTLPGPGVIFGNVSLKDSGEPVAAFRIKLKRRPAEMLTLQPPAFVSPFHEAGLDFKNKDGSFRIEGLNAGGVCDLVLSAPDQPEKIIERVAIRSEADAEPLRIELEPSGLRLAGVVRGLRGRPVAGAEVTLAVSQATNRVAMSRIGWSLVDRTDAGGGLLAKRQAKTDARGRFAFDKTPEGHPLDLFIRADGFGRQRLSGLETRNAAALASIDAALEPEVRVIGRVDMATYPEAGQATLQRVGSVGEYNSETVSLQRREGETRFVFEGLSPGFYSVQLEKGRVLKSRDEVLASRTLEELAAGEEAVVDFGPENVFRVAGQALINERPMSVGEVFLFKEGGRRSNHPTFSVKTDSEGRFVFKTVAAGVYDLVAFNGRLGQFQTRRLDLHPHRETLDVQRDIDRVFRFSKLGSMSGRLVPPPPESISVSAQEPDRGAYYRARTDSDGVFNLSQTPPGEYRLSGSYKKTDRLLLDGVIMPPDGSDVDLGDIPFELGDGNLRIVLEDAASEALTLAAATVVDAGPEGSGVIVSDRPFLSEPSMLLRGLQPGSVRCLVSAFGYRSRPGNREVAIVDGQTAEAVFQLTPVTVLSLSLQDKADALAELAMTRAGDGAAIQFQRTDPATLRRLSLEDGRWGRGYFSDRTALIRGAPEAVWTIRAVNQNGRVWTRDFALQAGAPASLAIQFR